MSHCPQVMSHCLLSLQPSYHTYYLPSWQLQLAGHYSLLTTHYSPQVMSHCLLLRQPSYLLPTILALAAYWSLLTTHYQLLTSNDVPLPSSAVLCIGSLSPQRPLLERSRIGIAVGRLRKHEDATVASLASRIVTVWKKQVATRKARHHLKPKHTIPRTCAPTATLRACMQLADSKPSKPAIQTAARYLRPASQPPTSLRPILPAGGSFVTRP